MEPNPFTQPSPETVRSWDGYLYFVYERELIRQKKAAGLPAPWTRDLTLMQYRFTNIRRRDDRMSKWFIENLIAPYEEHPDLWFALLVGRIINWPPTLAALMRGGVLPCKASEFDAPMFIGIVQQLAAIDKAYGDAYMVYPAGAGGVKSVNIAKNTLIPAARNAPAIRAAIAQQTVEAAVSELTKGFGVSTFTAGQVAADLTYCKQLSGATDLYTFAPIGPGSQRGLNLLHGYPYTRKWKQAEFNECLEQAQQEIVTELGFNDLTLHDVQNTFCEYSKYARASLGVGRPRNIYKPQTAY